MLRAHCHFVCHLASLILAAFFMVATAGADVGPSGSLPGEAVPLEIELRLPSEESTALEIELEMHGQAAGTSVVEVVADWGGSIFEAGIIEQVRAFGDAEAVRQVEVSMAPSSWLLEHEPGERLRLSYSVPANDFIRGLDGDSYYKPIVSDGLVHLIGHQTLLLPQQWPDDQPLDVTLRWHGLQENQVAVSSFGLGAGKHSFRTTKEGLRRGLFVAGEGSLSEGAGPDPVHVFVARGPWRFEPQQLASIAQKIVPSERAFFGEQDAGPFLITAIPIGPENPEHLGYGGTGLEHAFATFIVPVLELDEAGRGGLLYLLAHEKAHTWIGGRISSGEEPETAGYWFSEGVTDYYTPRLLHHAGLMSPEGVVEEWNGYLHRYFLSPAAGATNQQITDGFWADRDIQQLTYQRGAAVTLYLDQVRRRRTGGRARLDDLLLGLIGEARKTDQEQKLTNAELRAALADGWSSQEIDVAFATLIEGRPLDLPPDLLAPCADLVWEEESTFEIGFEVESSTGEILSVKEHTNAHRAGLRAGQRLIGWSIHYGDANREVELQRRTEDGHESVRFLPAGPKRRVPRFELKDASACKPLM